jgi:hypothetical protein
LLTNAHILLKADVSEVGEGWSGSRIAAAVDTNIATVERTPPQLVEEGFETVLTLTNPKKSLTTTVDTDRYHEPGQIFCYARRPQGRPIPSSRMIRSIVTPRAAEDRVRLVGA